MKRRLFERGVDCAHFSRTIIGRNTVKDVVRCVACGEQKELINFEFCSEYNARQQYSATVYSQDCKSCRDARVSSIKAAGAWNEDLASFWRKSFSSIRYGAKKRGIILAVRPQDCIEKYLEQNGRCAITGLPTKIGDDVDQRFLPSLDRINSSKHYTTNNIQIVLRCVNVMKGELPTQLFLEICAHIAIRTASGSLMAA